jgi:hypothetical protein
MRSLIYYFLLFSFISCGEKNALTLQSSQTFTPDQPALISITDPGVTGNILMLENEKFTDSVFLQKIEGDLWYFIPPVEVKQGEVLSIREIKDEISYRCQITRQQEHLVATIDDQEVLRYAIETQFPPDTLPDYYQRSGFIHPLKTLKGETLTAGFPRGHVHQHGIFHAWTRSHVRDSMIDFWNQAAGLGIVRHKELIDIQNGPVFSGFTVSLEYVAYLPGDSIVISDEIWKIGIFPLKGHYLVDWQIDQKCHAPDSLVIDEYHYGGAAFRGSEKWNVESGAYDSLFYFLTSEGKSHIDGNHSRPTWVAMHGMTENDYGGITMIQHPSNFRYPQPVRIHPSMPYFCFAPMVLGTFTLVPDEIYQARYRLLIFDGQPDMPLIESSVTAFNNTP